MTANTSFQSKGSFLCKTFTLACFFKARFLPFDWKTSSQSNFVSKGPFLCIVVGREKRMFETIWGETSHPSIFLSRLCSENNIWNHISTRKFYSWIILKFNSQIWGRKSILFYPSMQENILKRAKREFTCFLRLSMFSLWVEGLEYDLESWKEHLKSYFHKNILFLNNNNNPIVKYEADNQSYFILKIWFF